VVHGLPADGELVVLAEVVLNQDLLRVVIAVVTPPLSQPQASLAMFRVALALWVIVAQRELAGWERFNVMGLVDQYLMFRMELLADLVILVITVLAIAQIIVIAVVVAVVILILVGLFVNAAPPHIYSQI